MSGRFIRTNSNIYNISYHIIWCSKYRKRVLIDDVRIALIDILKEQAILLKCIIKEIEVMPDHIHIFISCNPNITISNLMNHLKGYSSFILRRKFQRLRKYKSLWTRSYYCESIGHISESIIRKYINDQLDHVKLK